MSFKIESFTAFIAVDPNDGDEGLIGIPLPGSKTLSMPAIAADPERAKAIYPVVESYCKAIGVKFKVIQMSVRTDVTDEFKKKYGKE